MTTPFRINILNSQDEIIGPGPLEAVTSLTDIWKIDEIPTASFTMPAAAQPRQQFSWAGPLIQPGVKFDIYDPLGEGYLGRYYFSSRKMTDMMTIKCIGEGVELVRATAGFRRQYNNESVADVVRDLLSLVPNWSSSIESSFSSINTVFSVEGESPYRAIDELRKRFAHLVFSPGRFLSFGAFGDDSGLILKNLSGQAEYPLSAGTAIIKDGSVTLLEEVEGEIWNSIIALGSGQGEGVQLTMRDPSAGGDYSVESFANQDGTLTYYIQDSTSVSLYGERWKILSFPEIKPLDSGNTARQRAALTLKLAAETYIKPRLSPKVTYQISDVFGKLQAESPYGGPLTVVPGQKVFVDYRGVVNGLGYMRVRGDFWIMAINRTRQGNGQRSTRLTIANNDIKPVSDSDVIINMQHNIQAIKVHTPSVPSQDRVHAMLWLKVGDPDQFSVYIGLETKSVLSAILRFKTRVLQSPVESVGSESTTIPSSGGGVIPTESAGTSDLSNTQHTHIITLISTSAGALWSNVVQHTAGWLGFDDGGGGSDRNAQTQFEDVPHSHTIPGHGHNTPDHTHPFTAAIESTFGKYSDDVYPAGVEVWINGINRTAVLGGPWGVAGAEYDTEAEGDQLVITDYLNDASGGLQQEHTIQFRCASSYGWVEADVHIVNSIQAQVEYY